MRPDRWTNYFAPIPRRVLMTGDTVGGVWTYALELTRALEEHGVEVALATMGAPLSSDQWRQAEQQHNLDVFESSYRLEWMDDPWPDVHEAGKWLLKLEQQLQPDLIHLNGYAHASLAFRAPKLVVGHSCVLSWWRAVKGEEAPERLAPYCEAVRRGLAAADRVVAPSRTMLRALEHHYGPQPRGDIICNGRQLAFAPGRTAKEPFVFSAGRLWDEAKNIRALAGIAHRLPWKVCVAGDASPPFAPGNEARGAANTEWLGRLAAVQIIDWYKRASIYALPARYEPFGLSILEAACCGCALVLGGIPSLREIWADAAVFVPPEDDDALEQTLRRLIEDEAMRKEMAARARARALEFTPSSMAAGYLALYSQLMNRETSAPELVCVS